MWGEVAGSRELAQLAASSVILKRRGGTALLYGEEGAEGAGILAVRLRGDKTAVASRGQRSWAAYWCPKATLSPKEQRQLYLLRGSGVLGSSDEVLVLSREGIGE